jgi:hypothetical protein
VSAFDESTSTEMMSNKLYGLFFPKFEVSKSSHGSPATLAQC